MKREETADTMRKPKIYLETTMFNHYFDADRDAHGDTVKLFEEIRAGKYEAYTSAYVADELDDADEPKRSNMLALINEYGVTVLNFKHINKVKTKTMTSIVNIREGYRHVIIASPMEVMDYE